MSAPGEGGEADSYLGYELLEGIRQVVLKDPPIVVNPGDAVMVQPPPSGKQLSSDPSIKAATIARRLSEPVVSAGGIRRLLETLSGLVENPVILEDAAHQVVDHAGNSSSLGEMLASWAEHSREPHSVDVRESVVPLTDPRLAPCLSVPIYLHGEDWGRLHCVAVESTLDGLDLLALERVATAITLDLLADSEAANLHDHASSAVMADILSNRFAAAEEIVERARGLGVDLTEGDYLVCVVVDVMGLDSLVLRRGLGERHRQAFRNRILGATREVFRRFDCITLSALQGDRVLTVKVFEEDWDYRSCLDEIGKEICREVLVQVPGVKPVIGISSRATIETIRSTLDEAMEAARYGEYGQNAPGVYHFADLGIHGLLLRLSEGPGLAKFVESLLGPLLSYETKRKTGDLTRSLEVFLRTGGNKSTAARELFIDRRTLYLRLEKIEGLINRNLDDQDVRLELWLALRSLKLLRHRSGYRGHDD